MQAVVSKLCKEWMQMQRLSMKCRKGFTLLELLISMTLLVLILVITMGAMRMGSRSVAAGEKKMEVQERLRTVLSILDAQIQSQVPLSYDEQGNKKYYFRGDRKTLRFATNHSIRDGRKGYVLADYRVEADHSGREMLYASERTPGVEGNKDTWLIGAKEMTFAYFYKETADEQGKWVENLSDGTVIPEKISFHMTGPAGDFSLIFPVRVRGEMTQVQGQGTTK
jgi:prepilin-type N-terminal cleavage/methylation domain-containing protein